MAGTDKQVSKNPTNLDEFLERLNITDWPPPISPRNANSTSSTESVINRKLIEAKLLQAAPLNMVGYAALRKDLDAWQQQIYDLGDRFISEKALVPNNQPKKTFYAPPQTFLTEIAESEVVQSLAGVKRADQQVPKALDEGGLPLEDERCFNVLKARFPGYRADAATDLPNWLELPGIVEKIAQAIEINSNFRFLWREIYLSQGSIVLMQDSFWWIFIDYFKQATSDHIIMEKDMLFDRMADTYVTLFFSVDKSVRDKFFHDYPKIFMQSIFLCFADGYPDSQYLYDDTFKTYLADKVSLWLQGVKAGPAIYKNWIVNSMLKADKIEIERKQREANMVFDPTSLDMAVAALNPIGPAVSGQKSVHIAISPSHSTFTKLARHPSTTLAEKQVKRKKKKESVLIDATSNIERVKYRMMGNSYLIDHHMRMHGVPIATGPLGVRSQEVAQTVKNTLTYSDLVADSRKAIKELENHLEQLEKDTAGEIQRVRKRYAQDARTRQNFSKPPEVREMDASLEAEMEVREMMKQAIKPEKSSSIRQEDDFGF